MDSTSPLGVLLCCILCLSILSSAQAIKCYMCNHGGPTETLCVTEPWNVTGINDIECSGQCFSERQVTALDGKLYSVTRGCDASNSRTDGNVDTGSMLVLTHTCDTDHCNNRNLTYVPEPTTPATTVKTTPPNPNRFTCYSCTYQDSHTRECIDTPEKTGIVVCAPPSYCYTKRIDYMTQPGTFSFGRGCEAKTTENGCTVDANFKTCYTFCQSSHCNKGDGTRPPINGHPGLGLSLELLLVHVIALCYTAHRLV